MKVFLNQKPFLYLFLYVRIFKYFEKKVEAGF